jgi:hypothetical protein
MGDTEDTRPEAEGYAAGHQQEGAEGSDTYTDTESASASGGAANGKDEDSPFGDQQDPDAWRADLPTVETVKAAPLSVFSPKALRALGRLYAEDVGLCLGLIRDLVATAGADNPEITVPKLRDQVEKAAAQWRREQKQADQEDEEADDKLSVQLLAWLEQKVIAAYFVDEYRRAFIDYRDPGTGRFLCRPALHDDIEDLRRTPW